VGIYKITRVKYTQITEYRLRVIVAETPRGIQPGPENVRHKWRHGKGDRAPMYEETVKVKIGEICE
jgi:hypothetical protein